jgi:hypothetical protein
MTNNIPVNEFIDSNKSEAVNKPYPWIMKRMVGICKVLFLSISKHTKRIIAQRMSTTISMNSLEIRDTNAEAIDAMNVKKTIGKMKWILICFASSPTFIGSESLD